jgi:uncharacterized protein (DUF2267 family)
MNNKLEQYLLKQFKAAGVPVTPEQALTITEAVLIVMRDYYNDEDVKEPNDNRLWMCVNVLSLFEHEFRRVHDMGKMCL